MIRKLTVRDERIYFDLTYKFYHSDAVLQPVPEENIRATFKELMQSDEYTECFLDERDGAVTAFMLISKSFSQEAGGSVVWIEEIYVLEEYRGRGIGSEFFEFLEKNVPAVRYRLEVEPENERAVALYERLGYRFLPYNQMIKGK